MIPLFQERSNKSIDNECSDRCLLFGYTPYRFNFKRINMTKLNVYLNFDGNTEEAFEFYRSVFGGEFDYKQKYSEVPGMEKLSAEDQQKLMHISFPIGGMVLMGSDMLEAYGQKYVPGNNMTLSVHPDDETETDRIFNALAEGGKVSMPLEKTFWSARFGMLTDRFGVQWMLNCELAQ